MRLISKLILILGTLISFSCQHSPKVKVTEVTLTDIKQEEDSINLPPPPPPKNNPPGVEISPSELKCFRSDGLKYESTIEIYYNDEKKITGNFFSEEIGSGKPETSPFVGTVDGNLIKVRFLHDIPVVGDASEWTDKPWRLEKPGPTEKFRERLHITFKAKNYETNKWEMTDYIFEMVDCK